METKEAIEMLCQRIDDLTSRIEALEAKERPNVQQPKVIGLEKLDVIITKYITDMFTKYRESEIGIPIGYLKTELIKKYNIDASSSDIAAVLKNKKVHTKNARPYIPIGFKKNKTGKSTFLKWLQAIYDSNMAILGNDQFKMKFNAHYITKFIISIDEGFLDVDKKAEKERL